MYRNTQKFASPRAAADVFAAGVKGIVRDEFGGMPVLVVRDFGSGRAAVAVFDSKSAKPSKYWSMKAERVEAFVAETVADVAKREDWKLARKSEKAAKVAAFVMPFKVGDVLHGSWGYDQTNCEFAEVVKIVGKRTVELRNLGHVSTGATGPMSENVVAATGQNRFGDKSWRSLVSVGGYARYNDHCSLSKWDGRPCYSSWYA